MLVWARRAGVSCWRGRPRSDAARTARGPLLSSFPLRLRPPGVTRSTRAFQGRRDSRAPAPTCGPATPSLPSVFRIRRPRVPECMPRVLRRDRLSIFLVGHGVRSGVLAGLNTHAIVHPTRLRPPHRRRCARARHTRLRTHQPRSPHERTHGQSDHDPHQRRESRETATATRRRPDSVPWIWLGRRRRRRL